MWFLPYVDTTQPRVHVSPILTPIHLLPSPSLWVFPERQLWVPCFMHWTWKCRSTSSCCSWFQLRNLLLFSCLSKWHVISLWDRYSWRTGWVYMLNFCLSLQMPSWQKWSTASLCFLFSRVQCKCVPFALLTTSHQSGIAVGGVRLPPRSGCARSPLSPGLAPMLCAGWWRGRPALSALLTEQGMEEECLSWSLNLQKGLGFSSVGLEWGVCA